MSRTKEWILKNNNGNQKSLIDRLLETRGIISEDAKREFLHPLEITLTHPNAFCDMQKAVERIIKAIDEKENILIYGDFDADGVTSTSVLLKLSNIWEEMLISISQIVIQKDMDLIQMLL